jgi:glycosyltransferase involved in cell wall biosynthesis
MNRDVGDSSKEASLPPERLIGILVTHRRPLALREHLVRLAGQTRELDSLIVVDNAPSPENKQIVTASGAAAAAQVTYAPMPDNLGPAGGIASGMRAVLGTEQDEAWCVLLDDDDPPMRDDLFEHLLTFAGTCTTDDNKVGMVGMTGTRFDADAGQLVRLADHELAGPVDVDYVAGGQIPLIRVGAIREAGPFRDDLFFGFDDLEFALRVRAHGLRVVLDGDLALWARESAGRLGPGFGGPRLSGAGAPWRRYYSVRNLLVILRDDGHLFAAVRVTARSALAKPIALMFKNPRLGLNHLRFGVRGAIDGWLGRMGRRVDPPSADEEHEDVSRR